MPYTIHGGLVRSRHLAKDPAELHERGFVEREIVTLRQGRGMAVLKKYELTAEGRAEANAKRAVR